MPSEELLASLHPLERKVLAALSGKESSASLVKSAGLDETSVLRALQWLEKRGLVKTSEKISKIAELGLNGKAYQKSGKGMPERRLLSALAKSSLPLQDLMVIAGLTSEELNISIGVLKKKGLISFSSDKPPKVSLTKEGVSAAQRELPEEILVEKLESSPDFASLEKSDIEIFEELKKRKDIVRLSVRKKWLAELTQKGSSVKGAAETTKAKFEDRLTPKMLRDGSWKGVSFRRYDITSQVPKLYGGKKQPYRRFLEEVRQKFIGLGFEESTGPVVETEFWNMDALFMPQFHSARDIHDAYYIKEPKYSSSLPAQLVSKVKKAHETGVGGSSGWRYDFDVKRTHRHVLRTQDTSISPRTLSSPKLKVPGKYFQIVRCFRYDVIDATHLADFNQTGGFVVEEGINLRHLFGLLKLFAEEFCETDQVKVTPAYFPFTEPSAALYAKHPKMGWLELAGAGIFRPEMCLPLGVKAPVIAWGIGLERLAMFKLGLTDIRQIFSHDLQLLRNSVV
ncbi:phenylalanine--tRNA ligase subunit alpha [Candidatus Woesearchaeota archaeon]|nr:phenylalanine--tRNA ligase subunit alpha [Candidatus Woesearchaeota archaeon]